MRIVRFCFATLALSVLSSLEGLLSLITRVFGNVSCADDAAPTRTHTLPVPRAPCFNANAMGVLYHAMRQHTTACVLCAATFPFIHKVPACICNTLDDCWMLKSMNCVLFSRAVTSDWHIISRFALGGALLSSRYDESDGKLFSQILHFVWII